MADGLLKERVREQARREIERRKQILEQKDAAEQDLMAFIRMFWHVVEPSTRLVEGWVLDAMVDVLMAVTDGHIKRLLINVSPGSMKSLLLNCFYPAWEWGPQGKPHLRYLSASYNEALPERDNDRFRRIVSNPVYKRLWGQDWTLTKESMSLVENSKTGWKRTTSTHSGTTGHRADRILIDDANDPNSVESDSVRASTIHWLREVMPDRLNNLDEGAIINLQQRTHEMDATGVLAKYGKDYDWLCIPMDFDPLRICHCPLQRDADGNVVREWVDPRSLDADGNELDGLELATDRSGDTKLRVRFGSPMAQAEGTLAWPERFSAQAMDEQKTTKGPFAWASQYSQIPGVRGGAIIRKDWWKLWPDAAYPELGTVIVSVDTATEEGSQNDFNACTAWGAFAGLQGEPLLLLIAAWRARLPLAQLVARIADTCKERRADYLLIEHKTRGRDVHDEIVRLYLDATWQTVLVKPGTVDKINRLKAVEHLFSGDYRIDPATKIESWSGGIVYAPDRDFADEVISEVASFPFGEHDDYCDTVSQVLGWVRRNGVILRKVEYDAEELARNTFRKSPGVPYAIKSSQ